MALNLREVEIFRPYGNESPEDLLWAEGVSDEQVQGWMSAELVRVAKFGSVVIGMYAMDRGQELDFILHGVVVEPSWRRQGLGRWLVGHALGVAESKGGRHVLFSSEIAGRFFGYIGFSAEPRGQRFDVILD
jgi:GNAT superfamily N-acetyltransferase